MMAAISAKQNNPKYEVVLLEKMEMCGRKLLITGKGRCNITSSLDISEFISNIPGNGKFLYSAFNEFTNKDIINFLKEEKVETKIERGARVFPVTDKSKDVLNAFINKMKKLNIKILYNTQVEKIIAKNNKVIGVKCKNGNEIKADKIVLATGGKSYPKTGSTGDGYKIAKDLGHSITKIRPSLVPLEVLEMKMCKQMQGLSLKNIAIKIIEEKSKKTIYEDFGEMLFTHFGVSGPIILSSSAHLIRYKNIDTLLKENGVSLYIDLKPALTYEKLDKRIQSDFEKLKNKQFKNSLDMLLPKKLIPIIIEKSQISQEKKVNEITKIERTKLVELIKNFKLTISNFRPIEEAIITAGGIDIKQINSSTMESKIIEGLFFAGEIIDVDAYTGGFNLQIAYSTGYLSGKKA